jgi:hypothetical protein
MWDGARQCPSALLAAAYHLSRRDLSHCFGYNVPGNFKDAVYIASERLNPSSSCKGNKEKQERVFSQILTNRFSPKAD